MRSGVAPSIAYATGFGDQMVLSKTTKYEGCTISSVNGLRFNIVQLEDNSSIVWGDSRELGHLRQSTF